MKNTQLVGMVFAGALALCACKQEPAYTISGTVTNPVFEGAKVYLMLSDGLPRQQAVDSTMVVDGRYTFEGRVTKPECGRIMVSHPEDWQKSIHAVLSLENVELTVKTDAEDWTVVSGSANNEVYQNYIETMRKPQRQLRETVTAFYAKKEADAFAVGEEKELRAKWDKELQVVRDMEYEYVKANINNPAFWNDIHNAAVLSPIEKQKALIAAANETTKQLEVLQEIIERVNTLERTAIGQPYIDLRMPGPDGKEIALSDYVGKGKYVLVDFWASWCGPCRAEIPNVKAAYEKYKNKGLEIVGISFDSKRERWLKAIEEEQLSWPQMSDLKGWDSIGAETYAVTGIPHVLLLDKEGKIIARNLYGEELQKTLAELIK